MKKAAKLTSRGVLFSSKFLLTGIFVLTFLSFLNAQNRNSAQWESVGGEMIASGNQSFADSWASNANSRSDNNKWWPGGFWDAPDTRQYTLWDDAVKNSVSPKIGEITILGPANIGLLQLGKKARIKMYDTKTNTEFVPWTNTFSWENDKWIGSAKDFNPAGEMWGAIPEGVEVTIDIYGLMKDFNNQGGTGEISYTAPQEVEYEIWFFPKEGGKVINSLFTVNNSPEPEVISGNAGKVTSGSVFNETLNKWLKSGDGVSFGDILSTSKDEEVNITFDENNTSVVLHKNTKVKIKNNEPSKKKWGVSLIAGRLWNLFKSKKQNGYYVETFNSVAAVEGTEFEVTFDPDSGTTSLVVEEGVVNFSCKNSTEAPVKVTAGMTASIDKDCLVTPQDTISNSAFSLPFIETFDEGLEQWILENQNSTLTDGKLYWNSGDFLSASLIDAIPMQNVTIEFDGYCESNGINIYLHNEQEEGYILFFGGWFNTKSGSDIGENAQNRELIDGKVWEPKKWHHYKVVINENVLEAYCDGRKIIERTNSIKFSGTGELKFNSYRSRIGIDNIKISNLGVNK